ncbi:DUF1382 family protein [Mannheimia sp. USDA-ARS-USMARC-1261]|uniref:DUF1382 family protein n=1 Tax=Mannheimia sp. USDA-ARS-USMARC-1261 TaxID=1432056 RepID=UPI00046CA938|nr:DUF1382 family protein [Mannheimia sp. USDA-ARS-USMARC-1261]
MIERCLPEEMRKNLEMVHQFERIGLDFVPIPVKSTEHKQELMKLFRLNLDEIMEIANATTN